MPLNTAGTPNTDYYTLGKGALYFAEEGSSALRHLGNAPNFSLTVETQTLEHLRSLSGLGEIDKEVTIRQRVGLSFSLDEIEDQNIAMFLAGSTQTYANTPAISGITDYTMIPSAELGRWYDIVDASGNRAFGIDAADVTLNETSGAPVLLVEDTDYTVDADSGRIFLLSSATNVADGEPINIILAANAQAQAQNQVSALDAGEVRGRLIFRQLNEANNSSVIEWDFKQASIRADGDSQGIGEEWQELPFTGTAEKDSAGSTLVITTPTLPAP